MSVKLFESEVLNVGLTSVLSDDGDIYFKAKDVALALGYIEPVYAIRRHVWNKNKFEWGNIPGGAFRTPGEPTLQEIQPQILFLTKPGVYQLIFSSKLLSAEAFQDWVFSEVLPSIRKTGSCTLTDPIEKLSSITLGDILHYNDKQIKEYRTILKSQDNMLKDPSGVSIERNT